MENDKESLEEKEQNCELQKESPLNLDSCCSTDWQSVTRKSFSPPENVQEKIGKRKMMLKKYFELQAAKEIEEEEIGDSTIVDSCCTEYIDNFCNPDFKPFTDNTDYDINKQIKYPLYGGVTNSIYKEQVNKGLIRSSVSNFNQPFRKSSSFTTPPEHSFGEIEY